MADFTPNSSASFNDDGGIGVGMEVVFDQAGQPATADAEFTAAGVNAYELYGTITTRAEGKADVLVRLSLDGRVILNANQKLHDAGAVNQWVYVPPTALKAPASTLKVHVEAAGAGNAWPINCEIELSGRWQ
jgi:hypothetical protein